MAHSAQEAGSNVSLLSMGGVQGQPQRGRQSFSDYIAIGGPIYAEILPANGRRIAAIFQNLGPGTLTLGLGSGPLVAFDGIVVGLGQAFQIDGDFPWTGSVWADSGATTTTIAITELSVP
jgi:hypothetical protein